MTYFDIASRLTLAGTADVEYSSAVPIGADNAVVPEVIVFYLPNPMLIWALTVIVQGSNDKENWSDLGGTITPTTPGYHTVAIGSPLKDVALAFVRLQYTWTSDDATYRAIVAGGLNTFSD